MYIDYRGTYNLRRNEQIKKYLYMGKDVRSMATKSFTTEYKFSAKSAPKLLNAIENQDNLRQRHSEQNRKNITPVKSKKRIATIIESYKG